MDTCSTSRTRSATIALLVLSLVLSLAVLAGAPAARAETGQKALILDSSVTGGASSLEATEAAGSGFAVTMATDAQWGSMTAAQFADYQLLVVGDSTCNALRPVVSQNAAALADAVMNRGVGNVKAGNRILIGTDPVFHRFQGGNKLVETGIDFAGIQDGSTNLYLNFSCFDPDYDANGTPDGQDRLLPLLTIDPTPGWTQNQTPPCGGSVSLISNAAQFSTLTTAHLQGWGCSVHETFPTFPIDWSPLAIATDTPTRPTCGSDVDTGATRCGEAYILIAGAGITTAAPNLELDPPEAVNEVGTTHTVTATVEDVEGNPLPGVLVEFLVTGANAGAVGTCVPADCRTDANGQVTFTYTGTNAGDDTINGKITLDGSDQTATAAKTWIPPRVQASIDDVVVLEGNAGTTPANFTVSLSVPAPGPITIDYATSDGSATSPADYGAAAGTVSFAQGEQSKPVVVQVNGDTIDEPNEQFTVQLSNPSGTAIDDGSGTGTIIDDDRAGRFSCRATALRIGASETATANAPDKPCRDDSKTALNVPLGALGYVKVLNATTDQSPDDLSAPPAVGDQSSSHADAADVKLTVGGMTITLVALEANAKARCTSVEGAPSLTGDSRVVGLRLNNGNVLNVTGTMNLPLGLVTLKLNQKTVSNGVVRVRAFELSSPLLPTIVIGEAIANVEGNPCSNGATKPPPR